MRIRRGKESRMNKPSNIRGTAVGLLLSLITTDDNSLWSVLVGRGGQLPEGNMHKPDKCHSVG